jgi:8-oxo-dGTP diphosphatase
MSREFPDRPVAGVGVRRGREPLRGVWTLPGGAIELGETMEAAAAREIHEETGLVVEVGPIVEVIDQIRMGAGGSVQYHYVLVDFLCRPVGGVLGAATDAADVRWVALGDLDALGVPALTERVIRKARALL